MSKPVLTLEAQAIDRDTLGRMVREAWVRWAETQPNPKPSWLVPYDELSEPDKEADRQIGETMFLWSKIHIEAAASLCAKAEEDGALANEISRLIRMARGYGYVKVHTDTLHQIASALADAASASRLRAVSQP